MNTNAYKLWDLVLLLAVYFSYAVIISNGKSSANFLLHLVFGQTLVTFGFYLVLEHSF